jgi:aspartate carbamoyltransferase catalytic subunit
MANPLYRRNLITIESLSRQELVLILTLTARCKAQPTPPYLKNRIVASCFFEASTRTRLSFEAAVHRLGGSVIGFADGQQSSSQQKGESLSDSIRIISGYADALVLRHPQAGAAQQAVETASGIPIINAGDGAHQHPTQALLDLFTIQETQGRLDDLNIAFVGDLKYGRTVHSLIQAIMHFKGNHLFLIAPEPLMLPAPLLQQLQQRGVPYSMHQQPQAVLPECDILYMTRVQQERFQKSTTLIIPPFTLTLADLGRARVNLKVLHPLPRVGEIALEVDHSPYAYYFQQARNGLYTRQALLALLLSQDLP